jgi:hypothetical protein
MLDLSCLRLKNRTVGCPGVRTAHWLLFVFIRQSAGGLWNDARALFSKDRLHSSRSHDAVIRVYDEAGNVIEVHRHMGDFKNYDRL